MARARARVDGAGGGATWRGRGKQCTMPEELSHLGGGRVMAPMLNQYTQRARRPDARGGSARRGVGLQIGGFVRSVLKAGVYN